MHLNNLEDIKEEIKNCIKIMSDIDAEYIESREIAKMLNLTEDKVQKSLDKLVEEKFLKRFFKVECPNNCDELIIVQELNRNLICEECKEIIHNNDIKRFLIDVYYAKDKVNESIDYFDIGAYLTPTIEKNKKIIEISEFKNNYKKVEVSMKKKIFISHSEKDKELVEEIVGLLGDIGIEVKSENIFCSSYEGLGVKVGASISKYIKEEFKEDMIALCIFSENYYASPNCLCELGAIWIKSKECIPIVTKGFDFADIKGFVDDNKGIRIEEDKDLNEFKDIIVEIFELKEVNNWENTRKRFKKLIQNL